MANVFDHLHIKRNTAGSSNELSFDVLDAARSGVEVKTDRGSRSPKAPGANKGSYHGVAGTSTLSGMDEVEKRKRARRVSTIRLWAIAIILMAIAFVTVLWAGYQHYLSIQDFSMRLDSLVDQFKEEDAFLAEVDTLMASLDDETARESRVQAAAKAPSVVQDVDRIKKNAKSAEPLAVSDEDAAVLAQVIETADARMEMLDKAKVTFDLAAERDKQADAAGAVWNDVVNAAEEANAASSLSNKAVTEQETKEAQKKTSQALESLNRSLASIKAMNEANPNLDLSAEISYLE